GRPKRSGWEPDVSTWGADAYNIVVDHCSISWGVNGNLNVSGPRAEAPGATSRNVTISQSILAEGLADSTHSKGSHSVGTVINDNCTNVALIGNIYAHNDGANPFFHANSTGVVVNNVIYDPGRNAIHLDWSASDSSGRQSLQNPRVSVAGNVMYSGP